MKKKKLNKNISLRDNRQNNIGHQITILPVGEVFMAKWDEALECYIDKAGNHLKVIGRNISK